MRLLLQIVDVLAALMLAGIPAAILFWLLIHPFAGFWRRVGVPLTYLVVGAVCLALAWLVWNRRETLLAVHWGYHPWTVIPGLLLYLGGAVWDRRVLGKLGIPLLVGLPEVSAKRATTLRTDGPYAVVRHPRYLGALVGVTGFALIANYPTLYLAVAASVPAGWLLIAFEERELAQRFGGEYAAYRARVPCFLPRLRG
ncbi:MAG: isoprenylcysteine carboxylmethyltransferase family protein [Thermoanaerobaculia bacterium]|nr:isoprenylcysteine carboxylmethyltransferase family protein [Thermoanaerobaculia bacterium]